MNLLGNMVLYTDLFGILDSDISFFSVKFVHVHRLCSNRNCNQERGQDEGQGNGMIEILLSEKVTNSENTVNL